MSAQLSQQLPMVRGLYTSKASLADFTTLKIGGPAEVLYQPADFDCLSTFMASVDKDIPQLILGDGSNVLIRDGGIAGVVMHIGKGCDEVTITGTTMRAEAGASTGKVARMARAADLTGVEFICGIPGSIGGALKMNAGCYGWEMVDILTAVEVLDDKGKHHTLKPEELGFAYRHSQLPKGWIFKAAHIQLKAGDKETIRDNMRDVNKKRSASQPLKWPNAGSFFKNPTGHSAWQLIEQAGCRGQRLGGAQVSEKHCNFFINRGGATAADMEDLAENVRAAVMQQCGVKLAWEVRRLGDRACTF